MILTPSLNRCASLLDDKKVDRVDLGWVTVTQGLTKRAWKLQVNPIRCSLITIGRFTFAASSGFALMVISISLNTWWFSFETQPMACDSFCPGFLLPHLHEIYATWILFEWAVKQKGMGRQCIEKPGRWAVVGQLMNLPPRFPPVSYNQVSSKAM